MRDYSTIVEELHNAQVELEELESIERHNEEIERGVETLKEVQKTLEQIAEDAEGTSKKIEEYREELDGVIEKLEKANEEFAAALKEQVAPFSEAGGEVAEGVSQFGEAAGEVSSTLKEIADRLDQVKELIDLGERPASEILEGFAKYFGDLVDLLGPLAERFPGLGAFVTIWVEAIRRIQGSVERIEAITATRRAQIEDIVGEDIYVGGEGPVAVRRGRIAELRGRVDALREEAAAHPDAPVPPPSGQAIVLQHESDFELARRAVEGDGQTVPQLQEDAFWADVALDEAQKDLAAWERTQSGQQSGGSGQSAAELEAELERARQALQTAADQPTRLRMADRIAELESAITTARATEASTAHGADLRQRVETARWFAAKAHARLTALLNRVHDWLVNDLRARGPASGRPQWNEDDHERFNSAHPEIPIAPADVQAPIGAATGQTQEYRAQVVRDIDESRNRPLLANTAPAARDRRPLALAAAAVLVIAAFGAAMATGFLGGQAPDQSSEPVGGGSASTEPSDPVPTDSSAPVASEAPAVGGSFDSLTTHGLWPDGMPSQLDATGDVIYSDPSQQPGHAPDYVDAILSGGAIVDASQQVVDDAFNASTFDCNVPTDILTVCITNADIPAGPILVVATKVAAQIPAEPSEGLVIYSLVLDSDGDPANDFEAAAPFTWDFYQGTDRWYELVYTPEFGWYLTVDRGETASDARVAIWGDHVIFFVPMSEFSTEAPGFRTTAFASTDASYAPQTSGGDVAPGPPDGEWELVEPAR